jgi:uncharacterized membrane protein
MFHKEQNPLMLRVLVLSTFLTIFTNKPLPAMAQCFPGSQLACDSTTTLAFCNDTSNRVYAAYATWVGTQRWQSRGWYSVDPGACRSLDLGSYSGNILVYGRNNTSRWEGGAASICVNTSSSFNYPSSDRISCNGSNQRRVGMSSMSVGGGTATYSFD